MNETLNQQPKIIRQNFLSQQRKSKARAKATKARTNTNKATQNTKANLKAVPAGKPQTSGNRATARLSPAKQQKNTAQALLLWHLSALKQDFRNQLTAILQSELKAQKDNSALDINLLRHRILNFKQGFLKSLPPKIADLLTTKLDPLWQSIFSRFLATIKKTQTSQIITESQRTLGQDLAELQELFRLDRKLAKKQEDALWQLIDSKAALQMIPENQAEIFKIQTRLIGLKDALSQEFLRRSALTPDNTKPTSDFDEQNSALLAELSAKIKSELKDSPLLQNHLQGWLFELSRQARLNAQIRLLEFGKALAELKTSLKWGLKPAPAKLDLAFRLQAALKDDANINQTVFRTLSQQLNEALAIQELLQRWQMFSATEQAQILEAFDAGKQSFEIGTGFSSRLQSESQLFLDWQRDFSYPTALRNWYDETPPATSRQMSKHRELFEFLMTFNKHRIKIIKKAPLAGYIAQARLKVMPLDYHDLWKLKSELLARQEAILRNLAIDGLPTSGFLVLSRLELEQIAAICAAYDGQALDNLVSALGDLNFDNLQLIAKELLPLAPFFGAALSFILQGARRTACQGLKAYLNLRAGKISLPEAELLELCRNNLPDSLAEDHKTAIIKGTLIKYLSELGGDKNGQISPKLAQDATKAAKSALKLLQI